MLRCLTRHSLMHASQLGRVNMQVKYAESNESGLGMLEYLLALSIFFTGVTGFMSVQLVAMKVSYQASQRSTATALARDIVQRMRANPDQLEAYRTPGIMDAEHLLPQPEVDCNTSICSAFQLAAFDLWQWQSDLLGRSARLTSANSTGLVSPMGCISNASGAVNVTVSWLAFSVFQQPMLAVCGLEDIVSGVTQHETQGYTLRRQYLVISTYIGGR